MLLNICGYSSSRPPPKSTQRGQLSAFGRMSLGHQVQQLRDFPVAGRDASKTEVAAQGFEAAAAPQTHLQLLQER